MLYGCLWLCNGWPLSGCAGKRGQGSARPARMVEHVQRFRRTHAGDIPGAGVSPEEKHQTRQRKPEAFQSSLI
jgi:hypothetical protein